MDNLTLTFCVAVTATVSALVIFALGRWGYRSEGTRLWTSGSVFLAAGSFLLLPRAHLPVELTIVLANLLVSWGFLTVRDGMRFFVDLPPARGDHLVWGALVVQGVLMAFFARVHPLLAPRIVVMSLALATVSFAIARDLRGRARSDGTVGLRRALSILYALTGLALLARIPLGVGVRGDAYFSEGARVAFFNVFIIAFIVANLGGTILLVVERLKGTIRQLEGILPICAYCKKIRAEDGGWQAIESYLGEHGERRLSHGVCPDCEDRLREDLES